VHHEDLRRLLEAQPFRPFRVTLTTGRIYEIRHPEFALLTHRLLRISVPDAVSNYDSPTGEEFIGVAVVHIVQYEYLPPRAAPAAAAS
jgi:hypothetical protein